ncbi:MAG TPA: 3D-(3,5/4)-trihydroxycyclohexane-1,2-dione acylhydrolase (decyclizing) [Vicinamibacterales bacterium]|nr:3D-(3,5/4)-trihydroxycyclohexane-1,2-dione acylhydrolase (decyclizing) [Vicinamibacterales bacterium]
MSSTVRSTMAQALVRFLSVQYTERDGTRQPFFGGMFGIFGHGNVAGVGQALDQMRRGLRYYQCRNEQAMVHTAAAYAKMHNRMRALACTTSIGPGATNMLTGAAGATINRVPVLLLPGDIFASRLPAPVLQQLESSHSQDISVNDCFKPVSRYWDRIYRPEQLVAALPEAMRVLTSPADTGAVTLALPQDTQAEGFEYPAALFDERTWTVARPRGDRALLRRAADAIRSSRRPVIIAGGGVLYSDAADMLRQFAANTGIPVGETQAGKGAMAWDDALALGSVGVTGSSLGVEMCREADLVISIGCRLTDFTTASKTAFQHADVRFIGINVVEMDAFKHSAIPVVADARAALEELDELLAGFSTTSVYRDELARRRSAWIAELDRVMGESGRSVLPQAEVIGAVNRSSGPRDVVVCAAGSLPGDLHKLWRTRDPKGYHLEYGYSCMGYEIAGGLGVKMAAPDRDVYVMVGDGSYLMMAQEIVTSVQEGCKLIIVLVDSGGFASIGGLSRAVGSGGFGTDYRFRNPQTGQLDGAPLPVDLAANAESLGARVFRASNRASLDRALTDARGADRTAVVYVPVDPAARVPGYGAWWDVAVSEVSEQAGVQTAREEYDKERRKQRWFV